VLAAGAFLAWMLLPVIGDQVLRTEVGYAGATALLALALATVYRGGAGREGSPARSRGAQSASTDRAIVR
jgi:hypothetical protein